MKKLLLAVFALAALSLLAPSAGFAQTAHNQLGVYTDMTGDPTTATYPALQYVAFTCYLVVTNPYNDEFDDGLGGGLVGRPVENVFGFECQVKWAGGGATIIGTTIPNQGTNFGTAPDIIVGYNTPVSVVNGSAVLLTWSILMTDVDAHEIFMNITTSPSIPGTMAIVDFDDELPDLVPMFPASGGYENHVFGINTQVVAIEEASWGNVKSLFR